MLKNELSGIQDEATRDLNSPYQRSYSLLFGMNLK
jgi:hypothetical protein